MNDTLRMIDAAAARAAKIRDRTTRAHTFVAALTGQLAAHDQPELAQRVWDLVFNGSDHISHPDQ